MTPEDVVRLLAEPTRTRVLAAVALGAETPAQVAEATGRPVKEVLGALLQLEDRGLLTADAHAAFAVDYGELRRLAHAASAPGNTSTEPLRPFIEAGTLRTMPARQEQRRTVLRHIARSSFAVGSAYDEPAVNEKLRAWCEGGRVDHVSVRRYLVDSGILARERGVYTLCPLPEQALTRTG
jgi:hypothetical protein